MPPIQHPRPGTLPDVPLAQLCDNQLRIDCSTVPTSMMGTVLFFVTSFEDLGLRLKRENEGDYLLDILDIQSIANVFRAGL